MPKIRIIFFLIGFLFASFVKGNNEYQVKFLNGKELLKQGKYVPAMEVFLPLTKEEKGNHFVEYSHYFFGYAALKANKLQDGYLLLLQLTQKYSDWEKIDEAYYLLTNIAFEQAKYRYGLNFLKTHCQPMKEDVDAMETFYFSKVNIDTLKSIQKSYPVDIILAKVLAQRLMTKSMNDKDKMLFNYLLQEYKFDKEKLKPVRKETQLKASYNVAVLFPFMNSELNPTNIIRSNQYALDMYEGIRMGADALKKNNIAINLFAYDTEKDDSKITNLLKQPEMKSMDMIIGPVLLSHNNIVSEFAAVNQIPAVNPLSVNSKVIENNPFVFLFQPSLEIQAQETAKLVVANWNNIPEKRNVMIIFSDTPKDTLLASIYRDLIKEKGFNVVNYENIKKDATNRIREVLSDSMKLTTTNHIFVSSSDPLVAANVISSMDVSKQAIPLITKSDWLQLPLLTFEQLQRRQVYFISPDFVDYDNPLVKQFKNDYIDGMGIYPSSYSYIGYELITLFGKQMSTVGTNFREGFNTSGFIPGMLLQGFDYTNSNTNQYVPIVHFEDHQLKLANGKNIIKEEK